MEEKELLDYWLIIYRKRWLVISVVFAAMITAGIISLFLPAVYESKAVFFVPQKPDVASYLTLTDTLIRAPLLPEVAEEPHSPYIGILKSKTIRELVQRDFPHKSIKDLYSDVDFSLSDQYLMRIYARDRDSVNAAAIANAYIKYLNKLLSSYSLSYVARNESMISQEINKMRQKLDHARKALREFQEKNGIVNIHEEKKQVIEQKKEFQSQLLAMEIIQKENESKVAALKDEIEKEALLYTASEMIIGSPLLNNLRSELTALDVKMASLKTEIRESHPDFIVLKNQYDQIEKNVNSEIERIVKSQIKLPDTPYEEMRKQIISLLVEKERIYASLYAYKTIIEDLEVKIMMIPELLVQEDSLQMDVEKYKKLLQALEINLEEAKMQEIREPLAAVVVEEATPSLKPSFPMIWLNTVVAGVIGLIAGVFYCFFVNYLDETREQRIFKLVKAIESSEKEG